MPFNLIDTDCSPLVIDYEYEINNKNLLAEYVGEMLLGHHLHINRIINSLSTVFPVHPNDSIDQVINKITSTTSIKRDGWIFQMISWIVLAQRSAGEKFFSNYPHFAPAQHGIDGLALVLNDDGSLRSIIITEDKCTTGPRGKITQQVFPEFKEFENGEKNNALVSIISILIGQLDAGNILQNVQNDIFDNKYRIYRIGITREGKHNDNDGRKDLFKDYNDYVSGDTSERRSGATIYLDDMRNWMQDFSDKVIAYLLSKKS
ncbi:hypothetical protein [Chryseobacterium sp. 'Rf worker isolate 10']|uniref:hypothetical protein n=1 Tax=Chryseobacterium sp. 'Rf worker isolate 10' TaxID=2887348 RepID=UPI003D6F9669